MDNLQLTPNFSLFELTQTTHADLQYVNRLLTDEQVGKLKEVAQLAEFVRAILNVPLIVHSGYRSPVLNTRVGSTIRSQHLKCEAMDFAPQVLPLTEAFATLRTAAKAKKFLFGQLIYERAARDYGAGFSEWIHISLGAPYREAVRCGQILTMNDGQYQLIDTV